MREPIRKVTLKDGTVRYRLVIDIGEPGGRRRQLTRTFDRRKDARDELSRIRHETSRGVFVRPSAQTLAEYLDEYIPAATRDRRESTRVSYVNAFLPVRQRLGGRALQSVTRADVEDLVNWMLTAGRRRGGKPGTGLGARSVRLTLGRLTAALEMAVAEGKLARNPAALVKPPAYRPAEREVWDRREVRAFLAAVASDRLAAAWRLSLYGLRRGEVLGLRWSDIDMKAKTLTVSQSRVLVDGRVRIEDPKSRNGNRTLPLDDALVDALTALRKLQMGESAAAGPAYQAGLADLGWFQGGEYVVTDALGRPVHPEWYSDEFGRIRRRAGLRKITLHDSRHTTLTLMEHAGVPISIISKWAGHYDSSFTQKTYVHASDDDLRRGRRALAQIHKIG
ncbi:MAG: tyrosine-type recombinase/integrase [Actinomycetota bacterium]|nr:tyrosine-type recombinase/integrase [Actinomycetota bacterium]